MKRIFLLATLFTLLQTAGINAQNDVAYPVDLNVQIIPPYNTCIRDLAPAELNSELGRFRVTMLVRDMSHSYRPFKIRMKVRDTSGRELFSTISGEIRVQAGYPNLLSSNQLLNDFFSAHNIVSGASNLQDGCFKEGAYVFAFQVVDGDNPALPVSRETQCFTFLERGAPPVLISPSNRSIVQSEVGIVVPFQWQLPYVTNVRETFILEVYEVPQGINPNQVFDNVSFRIFADENIPMTVCFVEKTAGTFEVGKQYAWRVRIKDREAYINNGISEVFTFTYGTAIGTTEPPVVKVEPTLPKVIIDSVSTNSGSAIVYWQNDPANFSGYIVEVRRAGSDAAWTSTSAGYEDNSLVLSNISPKIQYEVRIKGLEQQAGGPAYGIYSDTLTFQIASPEDIECGKPLPALDGSTPTAPGQEEYFTFYANGQAVEIEKITSLNGDNSFSGTGYIDFPLLKQIKIKVEFTNIQINENNELLSGTVRTVYDESTGLIMDLNRLLNKGDGGTADGPVQPLERKTYPSEEAALAGLNEGEFGQITGSDSIYVKTADNKLVPAGTLLPSTFKYENKGKLETYIPYIVFSKPDGANLAFDNNSGKYFDNVYRLKDTYEKLNTSYTVPWLAMNPGRIVHLDAAIEGGGTLDSIRFIIPLSDGSILQLDHNGTFDVRIPGGSAGTTTEIFAIAKVDDANKVVGKLKLANYAAKTQKVNLVPVRRDKGTIDGKKIEEELNWIYGDRLGIHFTVEVKNNFDGTAAGESLDFLDDGLQVDDKKFWSNETTEMKYLKYLYHQAYADEIDKNAAYIFVIDFANRESVQGDMPRGKQVGYVFCDNSSTFSDGHLIAHELGHGLYGLEHTFATGYGVPQSSTNNLMDYTPDNKDFLAAWQWKIINNPGIVWNFLEGDEDAMLNSNIHLALSPNGKLMDLFFLNEETINPTLIVEPEHYTINKLKYNNTIYEWNENSFSNGLSKIIFTKDENKKTNKVNLFKWTDQYCTYDYLAINWSANDEENSNDVSLRINSKIPENAKWIPYPYTYRDLSCDNNFIKEILEKDRQECLTEEVEKGDELLQSALSETDPTHLVNVINSVCLTSLRKLTYEQKKYFFIAIARQNILKEPSELAILRLMNSLYTTEYKEFYKLLENDNNKLTKHLINQIDDVSLFFWIDKKNYTNFIGALVTMFNIDEGKTIDDRWTTDEDDFVQRIVNLNPVDYDSDVSLFTQRFTSKKNTGEYDNATGNITLYDVYTTWHYSIFSEFPLKTNVKEKLANLSPLTPIIIIPDEDKIPLVQAALDGYSFGNGVYIVPAIFLKYNADKIRNDYIEKSVIITLDVATIAMSGGTAIATKVHWVRRAWAIMEVAGAVGDIAVNVADVSPELKPAIDAYNLAMGIIGIKNVGKGVVNFAKELPDATKRLLEENQGLRNLFVSKYLDYRVAITKLKNSDEWTNLSAEVRQNVVQQEKVFITLADAKNIPNDSWGAPQSAFINGKTSEDILSIQKGQRPLPETYLDANYITNHLAKFDDGIGRVSTRANFDEFGTLGGDNSFVLPRNELIQILDETGGNVREIERRLGMNPGDLGDNPVFGVFRREDVGEIRIPSGNEVGVNNNWIPGGRTSGGTTEAIIDLRGNTSFELL
jgi:hypothetical protein